MSDLNPAPRLLMGPGPINADPRVLRAMSAQLLGQFDPQFREYMKEVWSSIAASSRPRIAGRSSSTAPRASAIEAALASLIEPGDRVLVPVFGRFGHLKVEIARRFGAEVRPSRPNGAPFSTPRQLEDAIKQASAQARRGLPTATPRPRWRSRSPSSARSAARTTRCSTSTRPRPWAAWSSPIDAWQLDVGDAPACRNAWRALRQRAADPERAGGKADRAPAAHRGRAREEGRRRTATGPIIRTNYFDLAMIMDYWSDKALNHHTEATSMLYAARECARILLGEGLEQPSRAMRGPRGR